MHYSSDPTLAENLTVNLLSCNARLCTLAFFTCINTDNFTHHLGSSGAYFLAMWLLGYTVKFKEKFSFVKGRQIREGFRLVQDYA